MLPRPRSFFTYFGALVLMAAFFIFLVNTDQHTDITVMNTVIPPTAGSQTASAESPTTVATPEATTTKAPVQATKPVNVAKPKPADNKPVTQTPTTTQMQTSPDQAMRIENPYTFPAKPFADVNTSARAALVNILCMPKGGAFQPISGSGVIIDPRGVILTNAHVAQYVLLSESPQINLSCMIRSGSPAIPRWKAEILFIPPAWVEVHAADIKNAHPVGTGEHDYALLLITSSLDGSPLPQAFPYLPVDTREAIGFQGDQVLAASYPAEFLGGLAAQFDLFPASSIAGIGQLLTFSSRSVDIISLGGIIEAQSGSSGGAVVNAWGQLIALIATTSEGDTTAARDLRAVTLSYINRDLVTLTRFDLSTILGGDVAAEALDFNTRVAPNLVGLFVQYISR